MVSNNFSQSSFYVVANHFGIRMFWILMIALFAVITLSGLMDNNALFVCLSMTGVAAGYGKLRELTAREAGYNLGYAEAAMSCATRTQTLLAERDRQIHDLNSRIYEMMRLGGRTISFENRLVYMLNALAREYAAKIAILAFDFSEAILGRDMIIASLEEALASADDALTYCIERAAEQCSSMSRQLEESLLLNNILLEQIEQKNTELAALREENTWLTTQVSKLEASNFLRAALGRHCPVMNVTSQDDYPLGPLDIQAMLRAGSHRSFA